jgi:hypothetical protein
VHYQSESLDELELSFSAAFLAPAALFAKSASACFYVAS